jgi:hypothetical protein
VSIISTYRRYIYQLVAGVDFLRDGLGSFYAGTIGAVTDALLEGARQAFVQGLPGHPEQMEDSLNQVGADRQLFRYRGEALASWSSRVQNAWLYYEQAGTNIQVLRAVNEWGHIMFPLLWDSSQVFLTEGPWATFLVWIGSGVLPWADPVTYDSGHVYDEPNLMYDVSSAQSEDVNTLSRIIAKWRPARSKGNVVIVLSGVAYDEPGITYDSGAVYGGGFDSVTIQA